MLVSSINVWRCVCIKLHFGMLQIFEAFWNWFESLNNLAFVSMMGLLLITLFVEYLLSGLSEICWKKLVLWSWNWYCIIIFQELCNLTKSSICRCPAETLSRRTERKLPIRMDSHLWQLTGPKKFREVHPVRRWKIYVMKIRNSDSRFHRFLGSFHGILWNY